MGIYIYVVTLKINLACLRHNISLIKSRVNANLYAVVKADAYGHGAELCRYIEDDVYGFAVSCAVEAEELRRLKIKKPILILCPTEKAISREGIIYTVCCAEDIARLSLKTNSTSSVAIKVNSGMNRLGVSENQIDELILKIKEKGLKVSEVFTHFSSEQNAESQFSFMQKLKGIAEIPKHYCASNCLSLPQKMHGFAVRCGLALYGYGSPELLPILSAYTYVGQVNSVKKGSVIGYGDYIADKDMDVAVLKAGYADGIRRMENRCVRINGYTCKIVGKICMDMCMADVSNAYVEKGDRAYFLDNILNADVLASEQNTIPYEILTMFSAKRIRRIYA